MRNRQADGRHCPLKSREPRKAELDGLVAKIEADGGRAAAVAGDVKEEALAERLVDVAISRFGVSTSLSTTPA
jgi:hypothetical protein